MTANEPRNGGRTLAQIESDLLEAEAAFGDADHRLKDADRDRRAAIDAINKHQVEFDEAVTELRRRSAAGSRWRLEMESPEDALILQPADIAVDTNASERPRIASVSEEFDRLKSLVETVGNDRDDAPLARGKPG